MLSCGATEDDNVDDDDDDEDDDELGGEEVTRPYFVLSPTTHFVNALKYFAYS